jgi:hypothetical protein
MAYVGMACGTAFTSISFSTLENLVAHNFPSLLEKGFIVPVKKGF